MLRFNDVILARPVPLEHGGETEVKDLDDMDKACKKLDVLPIYYGLTHPEVDQRGGRDHAIGRARNLRLDPDKRVIIGDVELDVLPEDLAAAGSVGWSTWYHTAGQDQGRLTGIMWKHVLATPSPLDPALETALSEGYMVGESRDVSPPASPPPDDVKTVTSPTTSDEIMPDEKPVTKKVEAEKPSPPQVTSTPQPPPEDYTEARKELIQEYRDMLKGKLPDAALKGLTLKGLRETHNELKAKDAEAKEPEHPTQTREGLPAQAPTDMGPELTRTQGGYVTLAGDSFVEGLSKQFVKANPRQAPYKPLTGPVTSYSNVTSTDAAEKARLGREARKPP